MKHRRIVLIALLAVGGISLFALQYGGVLTEITLRPLLYLVADTQSELERIPLTLTRVSDAEEMQVGEQMASHYWRNLPEDDAGASRVKSYLEEIGQKLAAHVDRKGIRYTFHYVAAPNFFNAFALPGGHVFVGQGLLKLFRTEDELASVLAHEIEHVDRRHCIERLQYELQARKLGLGSLSQLASLPMALFQAGYQKNQELEADRAGLRLMVEAGYSPAGALGVMRRLDEEFPQRRSEPRTPVGEVASATIRTLPEYFRSHPPPSDRVAAFEREISIQGWDANRPSTALPDWLEEELRKERERLENAKAAQAHHERANELSEDGSYKKALGEIRLAISKAPDNAHFHSDLGFFLLALRSYEDARAAYRRAVELEPEDSRHQSHIVFSYFMEEKYQDAVDAMPEYPKMTGTPDAYALIWNYLALRHLGREGKARESLQAFSRRFEDDQWQSVLVRHYLGVVGEAELLRRARMPGEICEAQFALAYAHLLEGRERQAREHFQRALETRAFTYYEYLAAAARLASMDDG